MKSKLVEIKNQEYTISAIRSSGPGGQHANKVSTAVQLRYEIMNSTLTEKQKEKVLNFKDQRITKDKLIIITARRYKSQLRNKEDAILRLKKFITKIISPVKLRKKTKLSKLAKEKRLAEKSKRSEVKTLRKKPKI